MIQSQERFGFNTTLYWNFSDQDSFTDYYCTNHNPNPQVGTVLTDPACAPKVAQCGIASQLVGMLKDKQEDDEIVLQV